MQDYIRPQVREMAAQLRKACLSLDTDAVKTTTDEMEEWMRLSEPGSMEVGFCQGVLRFCAKQNSDPAIARFLLSKSDRITDSHSQLARAAWN
jgi:hypothetical protein